MNLKLSLRKKFRNSYLDNKVDAIALNCGSENDEEMNSEPCYENSTLNTVRMNDILANATENTQQKSASQTEVRRKICV